MGFGGSIYGGPVARPALPLVPFAALAGRTGARAAQRPAGGPWCMVPLAPRCKQSIADGKAGSPVLGRDSRKLPDSRQRRKKIGGPMSCGDGGRLGCLAGVRSTFSGARPSVGLQLLDLACGIANEAGSNFEWRQPVKLFPACYRSACDAKRTGDGGSRN